MNFTVNRPHPIYLLRNEQPPDAADRVQKEFTPDCSMTAFFEH
jgi:hypothetical protein